jgi:hypothetical protein
VGASRTQLFGLLIYLEAAPCEVTKDIRPLERKLHEVRPHPAPYDFENPLFSGNNYGRIVVASKNDSPTTESVSPSMEFIRMQTLEWVYHRLRQMLRGTGRAMSKKSWTPRYTDITFCMALLSEPERSAFESVGFMERTWKNEDPHDPTSFFIHGGKEIGVEEWEDAWTESTGE